MTDVSLDQVASAPVAVIRRSLAVAELPAFFQDAFAGVLAAVSAAGAQVCGPPFGWYRGVPGATVDASAGFPVPSGLSLAPAGGPGPGAVVLERPGGRAGVAVHLGSYDLLGRTYAEVIAWLSSQGLTPRGDMWEEYLSEPVGDPAGWRTRVVVPVG